MKTSIGAWIRRYGYSTVSLQIFASCVLLSAMIFEFRIAGTSSTYAWLAENAFARSGAVVTLFTVMFALGKHADKIDMMLKDGEVRTANAMNLFEKARIKFSDLETQTAGVDLLPLQRQEMERLRKLMQQSDEASSGFLRDREEIIVEGTALKKKFFDVDTALLFVGTFVWGFGDLLFRCPFCRF